MDNKYFEEEKFENLSLTEEIFDGYEFIDCTFTNCTFEGCKLMHSFFSECTFEQCRISNLKSEYSQIKFTKFIGCVIIGMNWSLLLPAGRFCEPIQEFHNCKLKYNNFSEMSFPKFSFVDNEITGSLFAECILTDSAFQKCELKDTEFFKCDIRKADFRNATGFKIDIMSTKVKGAKFSHSELANLLYGLGIMIE